MLPPQPAWIRNVIPPQVWVWAPSCVDGEDDLGRRVVVGREDVPELGVQACSRRAMTAAAAVSARS